MEYIAIIISVFSLVISGGTLYLHYFHEEVGVVGYLLNAYFEESKIGLIHLECSLSNTGNKQILIREIRIDLDTPGLIPEISCDQIPAVIKPGEISLIKFAIPRLYTQMIADSGDKISLDFDIIAANAEQFILEKTIKPLTEGGFDYDWVDRFEHKIRYNPLSRIFEALNGQTR